jgi:hypothetical protein
VNRHVIWALGFGYARHADTAQYRSVEVGMGFSRSLSGLEATGVRAPGDWPGIPFAGDGDSMASWAGTVGVEF